VLTCEIATHQIIFGVILLPLNLILVPIFSFQSIKGFLQSWTNPFAAKASVLLASRLIQSN
jgi:predicted membrane metal-binding protein